MLQHVECDERILWLERALEDADRDVRETAVAVTAWVLDVARPPWPPREDPAFDRTTEIPLSGVPVCAPADGLGWEWEYVVEVWRQDGLLIGAFVAATCAEDEEHAGRIALGMAILANTDSMGEKFDPASAASFIVEKRRVQRASRRRRDVQSKDQPHGFRSD